MMRFTFAMFAIFAALPAFAGEPDLSSPPAALRAYLAATKANDVETAKKCWTIDDGNASGALDVVAGMWIASRKLVAVTETKFGRSLSAKVTVMGGSKIKRREGTVYLGISVIEVPNPEMAKAAA